MITMFLSWALAAPPVIQPIVQTIGDAKINWTQMRLEAQSSYASRTQSWGYRESLASQDVAQKIGEYIFEVPVSQEHTVYSLQDIKEIDSDFNNLRDWKTAESRYIHAQHEVEVVGYLPLQSYLRKSIMHFAKAKLIEETTIHTGLIIDARGIDFQPLVMPTITNHDGSSVFSIEDFSPKSAQDTLPVRYVQSPVDPLCAAVVGKTPAMVRAQTSNRGTLVLAEESVLPSARDLSAIQSMGKIIIVISPFE